MIPIVRIVSAAACLLLAAGGLRAEKLVNDETGLELDARVLAESPDAFYVAEGEDDVRTLDRPPWRRPTEPPTSRPAPPVPPAMPGPTGSAPAAEPEVQPTSRPAGPTADELAEQLRRLANLDVLLGWRLADHDLRVAKAEKQLAKARETMTEQHPKVIELREVVQGLKDEPLTEVASLREERAMLLAPFEPIWRERIASLEEADRKRAVLYKPADPGRRKLAARIAELKAILAGPVLEQARGGYMNLPEAAVRIVFVVDRSGSMFDTFDYVRAHLRSMIWRLHPQQQFHVIFFARGVDENPARALVPATEENKRAAHDYLSGIVSEGPSNLGPALRRAFAVTDDQGRPADTIYLLSDGELERKGPDGKTVSDITRTLAALRTRSRARIRVHTIDFIYPKGEAIMRKIAEQTGGTYKFISRDDLGR